eukprot:1794975-Amphidinium_carterae.1
MTLQSSQTQQLWKLKGAAAFAHCHSKIGPRVLHPCHGSKPDLVRSQFWNAWPFPSFTILDIFYVRGVCITSVTCHAASFFLRVNFTAVQSALRKAYRL